MRKLLVLALVAVVALVITLSKYNPNDIQLICYLHGKDPVQWHHPAPEGFPARRKWASGGGVIMSRTCLQGICKILPAWDLKKAAYEEYDDVMVSRMAQEGGATLIDESGVLWIWTPSGSTHGGPYANYRKDIVTYHHIDDIEQVVMLGEVVYDVLGYGLE
ncbi:hypothetical protein Pelo_10283 [Pelomyxa schiedti]|nr:hypothetical protein Pelo_10264 [Pelomyxa schiedti]KAH3757989.1 hypothetical protein Pelo_10283 [Pelomyxa schiedti]